MNYHLFFDLDGTLVDSVDGTEKALKQALEKVLEVPITIPPMHTLIGPSLENILLSIVPNIDSIKRKEIITEFRRLYDTEGYLSSSLYEGVFNILNTLNNLGFTLHIITNKSWSAVEPTLARFNMLDLFDLIWASDKPGFTFTSKAQALELSIKSLGLDPGNVMMVGDSIDDYEAAINNNTHFICAGYGYGKVSTKKHLHKSSIMGSFIELPKIINSYISIGA